MTSTGDWEELQNWQNISNTISERALHTTMNGTYLTICHLRYWLENKTFQSSQFNCLPAVLV